MADTLIPPAVAARSAGISKSSIRNHTSNPLYYDFFSENARRAPRSFTVGDVRLLRFIGLATAQQRTHEQIAAAIRAGALDKFDWQPPAQAIEEDAQEAEQGPQGAQGAQESTALVLANALRSELLDTREREQELIANLIEISEQIGKLRGQLMAKDEEIGHLRELLRGQVDGDRPGWLRRLLGGGRKS